MSPEDPVFAKDLEEVRSENARAWEHVGKPFFEEYDDGPPTSATLSLWLIYLEIVQARVVVVDRLSGDSGGGDHFRETMLAADRSLVEAFFALQKAPHGISAEIRMDFEEKVRMWLFEADEPDLAGVLVWLAAGSRLCEKCCRLAGYAEREAIECALKAEPSPPLTVQNRGAGVQDAGPRAPDRFVYKGIEAILPPIPWRLLNAAWNATDRTLAEDVAYQEAWGENHDELKNAMKSTTRRVNAIFEEKQIPLRIERKSGHVRLIESI